MVILRYSVAQLVVCLVLCAITAGLFLLAFLYPEAIRSIPRIKLLATEFGHMVAAPLLVIGSLVVGWRAALIAVSDRKAVEAMPDGLAIHSWWRRKLVPWGDLCGAQVTEERKYKTPRLVVHAGGWEAGLGLSTTEHKRMGDEALVDAILAARDRALGRAAPVQPGPVRSPPVEPAPSGFDADAALANYLTKKQAGLLEAPAPSRGFGRKGL